MENNVHSDELQHHGIKGMRWGQRRYQNPDGSLTKAGQKRYNKEVEKLKAETAKVKAAEKVAATRAKTQSKLDKLEAKKQELEARKKALKDGKNPDDDSKKTSEETLEQRRERLLKSTDPKELYEGKNDLTSFELNERLQRIDLEARLQGKIPAEHQKTGMEYVNDLKSKIDTATNLYRSVDNAFSTVTNSAIGKTLAKSLGIELPKDTKPRESLSDFLKNIDKKSDKEIQDRQQVESNIKKLRDEDNRQKKVAEKEASEKKAADKKAAKESSEKKTSEAAAKKEASEKKTADKAAKQAEKKAAKEEKKAAKENAEHVKSSQSRNAEVEDLIRKTANELSKSNTPLKDMNDLSVNDSYIQDILKRNDDLLK